MVVNRGEGTSTLSMLLNHGELPLSWAQSMRIGIAVIGLGRMGRLYVDIVKKFVDGAELVGVYSRTLAKAEDIARSYGVKAYRSLDEVARDQRIDGVIVATPSYTHSEIAIYMAEHGKHVFVEKPIDVDVVRARRAIEACRRYGVAMLVGYMRRFDRAFAEAKRLIDSGAIGKPIAFIGISKDPEPPPEGWLRDPRLSGGLILDLMSHDFDLARWYLGSEPLEVFAHGDAYVFDYMKSIGDHDNAAVFIKFENGSIATIYGSRRSGYGYDIRCEIHGTEGKLSVGLEYDPSIRLSTSRGMEMKNLEWFQQRFFEAYVEEIRHFINVVKGIEKPRILPEDALQALRVAIAARKSIEQGRPVYMSSV